MPNLSCPCGEILDLSLVPVPGEHLLIPVGQLDQLIADQAAAVQRVGTSDLTQLEEALSDTLAGFGCEVYRCPNCGRLIVVDRDTGVAEFFARDPAPDQT